MGEPREPSEALVRHLQTRRSLSEPELLLPGRSRRETIRAVRRALEALRRGTTVEDVGAADHEAGHGGTDRPPGAGRGGPGDRAVTGGRSGSGTRPGTDSGGGSGSGRGELPPEPPPLSGESALGEEELSRLSREGTGEEIREMPDLPTLERVANGCVRCPLHESRQSVVFGEGSPRASVVCVGEAPGSTEDRTGRPFVGPAGKLLDRLLLSAGFRREEVFICNVLKCRPPGNRDPRTEEIERCSPYLHRQLELLEPEVIVAFGTFASQTLLDARESLGRLRRQTHLYREWPLVATYHPAALLRNPKWTVPAWEDLQKVRRLLEDDDPSLRPADSERMQVEVFGSDE